MLADKAEYQKTFVLVLCGIEPIYFTVANMGLCFPFVLRTVLITRMFYLLLSTQGSSASTPTPPVNRLGVPKKHVVGPLLGQVTPTDSRHIQDQMNDIMSSS